jgi:glycosyltransferase involved in cell wall biosynthesis
MHDTFLAMSAALSAPTAYACGTRGPDTIVVGTYPPTRCGLATFTANTRRGLLAADPERNVEVLRLGLPPEGGETMPEVCAAWPPGASPAEAAAVCAGFDVVLVQHEFGIYDGHDGAAVIDFADVLEPPLVSVIHTVLLDPTESQRTIIEELAVRSERLIVLSRSAAHRLVSRHRIDPGLVRVIPHGADLNLGPPPPCRPGPPVVLTWGLLGPGKGIEHGIKAVAILAGRGLRVRYLVAGQTHPNVLAAQGEQYRDALRSLAADLGVADLVELDDGYRDWPQLQALVRSAGLVLLPYDSREQVTSGVLVEALASAKPIVATAFPHAVEVVADRAGIVVPHEAPHAIADAIERLLTTPALHHQCAQAALLEGVRHAWPTVGAAYDAVLREVVGVATEL